MIMFLSGPQEYLTKTAVIDWETSYQIVCQDNVQGGIAVARGCLLEVESKFLPTVEDITHSWHRIWAIAEQKPDFWDQALLVFECLCF